MAYMNVKICWFNSSVASSIVVSVLQVVCDEGYVGPDEVYTCSDGVWSHVNSQNPTGIVGSCNCECCSTELLHLFWLRNAV